jgi:hypothetical protein
MALAGGESGPVIVPGEPEKSALVEAIKWEALEMPPTGKLNENQIATLTEWIRIGAPMPKDHGAADGISVRKTRGVISDEDRQWWAFLPIRRLSPPAAQRSSKVQSPRSDRCVLAGATGGGGAFAGRRGRSTHADAAVVVRFDGSPADAGTDGRVFGR